MTWLYMDKNGQTVNEKFTCKHVIGKVALNYLNMGFSVEVYENDFPLANFKDELIETDQDGFAHPAKKENTMEEKEKERIVKISLEENKFKSVIDYLIKQGQNELAGNLFFGVENYVLDLILKEKEEKLTDMIETFEEEVGDNETGEEPYTYY